MSEELTIKTPHVHWKQMTDKDYLYAEMFEEGEEKILTIKAVVETTLQNPRLGTVDIKPVLYFEETDLKLALNETNSETITNILPGNGFVDKWIGQKIQLFATTTKVGKEVVPCIRVRNFVPELKCSVCGKPMDEKLYSSCIKKYGKPYCSKECYEKSVKGEDLLDD